jgi:hypothetical protein
MIQRFTEDDDGSPAIEMDAEGIDFLISGLMDLAEDGLGGLRTADAIWANPAPWWRFWDRSEDPVVGQIRLRYVE